METTFEIVNNLIFSIVWALLSLAACIGVIFCGAYWHIGTAIISAGLSVLFFCEKTDGKTVKLWLKNKLSK